jgi:hypothetical protein
MANPSTINPAASTQRLLLRVFGGLLTATGGIMVVIALVDFFSAFSEPHFPTRFWCAFVGLPLLAVGVNMLGAGFQGAVTRYIAGETAPVAVDTIDAVARGSADAVRTVAAAVREGMQSPAVACGHCGSQHPGNGRFCDDCGKPLGGVTCGKCGAGNFGDARFCGSCGAKMGAA